MYTDNTHHRKILEVRGVKYLCPPYDFSGESSTDGYTLIKFGGMVFRLPEQFDAMVMLLEIADHDRSCEREWMTLEDGPPELNYPREGWSPCNCAERARTLYAAVSLGDT